MTVEAAHVVPVAIAGVSAVGAGVIVGIVVRALMALARRLARKTKTTADDRAVEFVARYLEEHPEALPIVIQLIDDLRRSK